MNESKQNKILNKIHFEDGQSTGKLKAAQKAKNDEFLKTMLSVKENNPDFDFILLAPFTNRANPSVGLPLMLKKIYLGYGRKRPISFTNPDSLNEYKYKSVSCDWITTFSDAQDAKDKTRLINNINYYTSVDQADYDDEYYEMENMTMEDGTHPIRISNFRAIPDDYNGWMFCAIGVLDILSNEEFEWYGTNFHKYFNSINKQANPFIHKLNNDPKTGMYVHNGKSDFAGIVCRRRTPENGNMVDVFKHN